MSPNLSSIDPYYLAGVLDKSLTMRFRNAEGPCGAVCGPRSLLSFIQGLFGGKVDKARHERLRLRSSHLEAIAQYLSSTSCAYQKCYQTILQFKALKTTFYNRYHLSEYKERRKQIGIDLELAYRAYSMPNLPYGKFIPYRAGVIEASKWLTIRSIKGIRKIVFYPEGNQGIINGLDLRQLSKQDLCAFISEHCDYFSFRKEVFLKAKDTANLQMSVNDFELFRDALEQGVCVLYSESKDQNTLDSITKRKEERELRAKQKQEARRLKSKVIELERQQVRALWERKKEESAKIIQIQKEEQKARGKQRKEHRKWERSFISEHKCYCRKCEQVLPLDSFTKAAHTHTGYSLYCKSCCKRDHYDKDRARERSKIWRKKNPESYKSTAKRQRSKPHRKIRTNISRRIKKMLTITSIQNKWRSIVSCTPKSLIAHLESQFSSTMSWTNHGSYWHIDHIVPCAAFDCSKPNHLEWCWHYKNLRPLPAIENERKRDFLPSGDSASVLRAQNIERLKQVVGPELERLGIATAAEYALSWDSSVRVQYVTL